MTSPDPTPGLPPGITLDPTGLMSGVPTEAGVYQPTFQVEDSAGNTATATFTMTVFPGLTITITGLPGAVVGQEYSFQLTAVGGEGDNTWSVA